MLEGEEQETLVSSPKQWRREGKRLGEKVKKRTCCYRAQPNVSVWYDNNMAAPITIPHTCRQDRYWVDGAGDGIFGSDGIGDKCCVCAIQRCGRTQAKSGEDQSPIH